MTTFAPSYLNDGELPTVQGSIFTATADIGTYLKSVLLFNKNAATQTIDFWIFRTNGSGTPRKIRRMELLQNESAQLIDSDTQSIRLGPGDELQAQTTTVNAVDFDIDGVTEVN
jgi:hypothetical protein